MRLAGDVDENVAKQMNNLLREILKTEKTYVRTLQAWFIRILSYI
jgi:hypothetical protein